MDAVVLDFSKAFDKVSPERLMSKILHCGVQGHTRLIRYIYSQKNDSKGVAPLKEDGSLFTDSRTKAEILNTQFVSVFTRDTPGSDTFLHGPSYPPIRGLQISTKGVEKLLAGINPTKAAGPDLMPCRFMKELAPLLAPILTAIFHQSMDTGVLPSSWLTAYVTPIFKKGSTCLPENYRPVSLTCVACKLLEHVICSIDLARNSNSGCANEILGCAKCHFWWKSPWKWKN